MAFFKTFRDQLTCNAMVSHLEFARDRFDRDPQLGLDHLAQARKALDSIAAKKAHEALSSEGWTYVIQVCDSVGEKLALAGRETELRTLADIVYNALLWKREADAK